ncbi:hypothetical protein [Flavobacterium sp. UBA6135]|uniref:hypothetical protein n=1 Tax=Flavobacterium sp. UBA6135 TaxID=1946553 RepID=UPI0025BBE22A|nr:hypothetical protein [Flavobacterium sp. UBA6135]
MKKFIFCAVAMMAFSVSSMANTIDNLNLENITICNSTKELEMSKSEIENDEWGCFNFAITVYHGCINRGRDVDWAIEHAEWAYNVCMDPELLNEE